MKRRILIADSDVKSRSSCKQNLPGMGLDVEVASDGLDCLQKLRDCPPDLVVLDFELLWGGGDGVVALMQEEVCTPPILLVTKRAQPKRLARQLGHPVEDGLRKPIEFDELAAKIQCVLARCPIDDSITDITSDCRK